ncbi:pyrimidodiazepine synthase-like [Hetaerina americana]|uniref:pyrimidodiazepine synthase-like n=1 Tax=Hetaerina americana TaxID=62018 RepID=UPI003A7F5784
MSAKHLGKGSKCPPLHKGKLRLYSMQFCPYAQRCRLVLDTKKIPYDVVNINLTEKPDWLLDRSPLGKVPALEVDGTTIYESLIIADFLDEKYPQRPLLPKDPMQKAKDKILMEQFNMVISAMFKLFYSYNHRMDTDFHREIVAALDVFEKELVERGTPFFGGDKPGMLDYMIWPWCERADLLNILGGDQFKLPKERLMRLMEWRNAMKEDEGVRVSYLDPEVHAKFLKSKMAGTPDYDLLVSNL